MANKYQCVWGDIDIRSSKQRTYKRFVQYNYIDSLTRPQFTLQVTRAIRTRKCHLCGDKIEAKEPHLYLIKLVHYFIKKYNCYGEKTSRVNVCLACSQPIIKNKIDSLKRVAVKTRRLKYSIRQWYKDFNIDVRVGLRNL